VAAVVPAVLVSWLIFGLFLLGVRFLARPIVLTAALNPIWLVATLVIGPLLALLSVLAGIIASSRMSDPRAVQQLVAMFVVPIILVGVAQVSGLFTVSLPMILLGALLVAVLDGGILWVAVRLFQREAILTRWR
jgi:ABC-2 type transport system permease protein